MFRIFRPIGHILIYQNEKRSVKGLLKEIAIHKYRLLVVRYSGPHTIYGLTSLF